jgi:UDP-galactopyranose mutase
MYDYIIVGSGMFGSVFAYELNRVGKKVLVLEKRNHIGGNCYTEKIEGINIHKYGAHIFHTNDKRIWDYINQFAEFNHYTNRVKVNYKNKLYSFPINLFTLYQLWGVKTPQEAKTKLEQIRIKNKNPLNLEEWILSQVGEEIYEIFIKGYTTKQWEREPKLLPASIIKRLPIRLTFDDNYFNDKYQGIPIGGYTQIFEKMLSGIEVITKLDFLKDKEYFENKANKIIFTGKIDELFQYEFGQLEYRSLKFENEILNGDFQGNAVINYTEKEIPYTRIIEHKHFEFGTQEKTLITKEYPDSYDITKVPYYPMSDEINLEIYKKYKLLTEKENRYILGGRLAEYKYYDMHQVIGSALVKIKKELNEDTR